jgi:hypothetical protein
MVYPPGTQLVSVTPSPSGQPQRHTIPHGVPGFVAMKLRPLNVSNVADCLFFNADDDAAAGYRTRNLLALPVISDDVVIGVVELANKAKGPLDVPLHEPSTFLLTIQPPPPLKNSLRPF